jgi:hypothetical protein
MLLRLWVANSRDSESSQTENWTPQPGILALVEDVVASKNGVVLTAQDQIYVSGFQRPTDALVASRQVQIGVQGFRRAHPGVPLALSIAIDATAPNRALTGAAEDAAVEPPHELVSLLRISKPAQILLTHDLFQLIANSAGVPLKPFPSRFGVQEYIWTAEDQLDVLKSEPQLTLAVLPAVSNAKSGATEITRQEPKPSPTETGVPVPATLGRSTRQSQVDGPNRWGAMLRSPRVLVMAGIPLIVASVLVIVGIQIARSPGREPAKPTAPVSAQSQPPAAVHTSPAPVVTQPQPPPVSSQPVSSPSPRVSSAPQPKPPRPKKEPRPAETTTAVVPPPLPAYCQNGSYVANLANLAEQSRLQGKFAEAERRFRDVLACDPHNAAALSGLQRARIAQGEPPD